MVSPVNPVPGVFVASRRCSQPGPDPCLCRVPGLQGSCPHLACHPDCLLIDGLEVVPNIICFLYTSLISLLCQPLRWEHIISVWHTVRCIPVVIPCMIMLSHHRMCCYVSRSALPLVPSCGGSLTNCLLLRLEQKSAQGMQKIGLGQLADRVDQLWTVCKWKGNWDIHYWNWYLCNADSQTLWKLMAKNGSHVDTEPVVLPTCSTARDHSIYP